MIVLLAALIFSICSSQIITLDHKPYYQPSVPSHLNFYPIYNLSDSPVEEDAPVIKFDLTIESQEKDQKAFILIGMRDHLLFDNRLNVNLHVCDENEISNENFKKYLMIFDKNNVAKIQGVFPVKNSGLYSVTFTPCGEGIYVTGEISFKNSFGYLPAHRFNFLAYNYAVILTYLILVFFWVRIIMKNKGFEKAESNQILLLALLIFTIAESLFNLVDLGHLNDKGTRLFFVYILSRLTSVLRKTIARGTLLLVGLGFGIFSQKVEDTTRLLIFFLPSAYFFFELALEIALFELSAMSESSFLVVPFLKMVVTLLNIAFYATAYKLLQKTLESLKCHKKEHYKMYNNFNLLLIASFFISFLFYYQEVSFMRHAFRLVGNWGYYWFYDRGFWMIQYTIITVFLMHLWKPSTGSEYGQIGGLKNLQNQIFGVSDESGDDGVEASFGIKQSIKTLSENRSGAKTEERNREPKNKNDKNSKNGKNRNTESDSKNVKKDEKMIKEALKKKDSGYSEESEVDLLDLDESDIGDKKAN